MTTEPAGRGATMKDSPICVYVEWPTHRKIGVGLMTQDQAGVEMAVEQLAGVISHSERSIEDARWYCAHVEH